MKRIYFVRHGATENNIAQKYQSPTDSLGEKGKEQAQKLADRFKKISVDIIVASTMTRAAETADIIAVTTGHSVIPNDDFREIRRPKQVQGRSKEDPDVKAIVDAIRDDFNAPTARYSDEERFPDLYLRATRALEFLVSRPENNILAVTHGTILEVFISIMMRPELRTSELFDILERFIGSTNTGITLCEYDEKGWRMRIWNDHAHLG